MRLVRWSAFAIVLCSVTLFAADIKFLSTWKSPDAATTSLIGKKVATLVIADEDGLRVAGEEALARELEARGIPAIATYRIVPKPELATPASRSATNASGNHATLAKRNRKHIAVIEPPT